MHGVLPSAVIGAPSPQEDQRALDARRSTAAARPPLLSRAELRCPAPDGPTADRVSFVLLYFWSVLFMPVQVHCRDFEEEVPAERVRETIGMIFNPVPFGHS